MPQIRQRDIARHRQTWNQSLRFAILRKKSDTVRNRISWIAQADLAAADDKAPVTAPVCSGKDAGELGAAGPQ